MAGTCANIRPAIFKTCIMNPFVYLFRIWMIYIESWFLSVWSGHTNSIKRMWWIEARLSKLLEEITSLNKRFKNERSKKSY